MCEWTSNEAGYTTELKYYGSTSGYGSTTAGLLAASDGDCDAWARLLRDCLLANNVSNADLATADEPGSWEGLGVKNIGFGTPTYDPQTWGRFCYLVGDLDTGVTGIGGQNMTTPAHKLFNYHKMVYVGSTYYDPAYGKTIADNSTAKETYTDESIDAWADGLYRNPPGYPVTVWSEVQGGDPALDFSH